MLVKCAKCEVECTLKKYRKYDCSTAHEGIAIIIVIIIITSSGDLQPSTAIANQLPGQLVYTQITTRGPNFFKFIIPLIMPSRNII